MELYWGYIPKYDILLGYKALWQGVLIVFVVPWINHLPLYVVPNFRKTIPNKFVCKIDAMENSFHLSCKYILIVSLIYIHVLLIKHFSLFQFYFHLSNRFKAHLSALYFHFP